MSIEKVSSVPRGYTTKYNLAQLYFQASHGKSKDNVRRLSRMIRTNPVLVEELEKRKYVKSQRYFTPSQLEVIYEFCEEPI